MINFDTANSVTDLQGILELQKANLKQKLSQEEIKSYTRQTKSNGQ